MEQVKAKEEREALAAELDRHVGDEEQILEDYHRLSDQLPEGPLGLVVNHIATDEEMHHFLLRTLADWVRRPEGIWPPQGEAQFDRAALLRLSADLQAHEEQTIDACKGLQQRMVGPDAELLSGLLEAIALDSQKHHRLLAIVVRLLESRFD